MLAVLLALTLAQSAAPQPSISMVISRRSGIAVGRGLELGDALAQALARDGIHVALTPSAAAGALAKVGILDTGTCAGEAACVARLAGPLHTRVVIGVDLAQVVDQLAVHLVALPASREVALADGAFVADAVDVAALSEQLAPFVRQLKTALQALPPEAVAPKDANLLPPMTPESPAQAALHTAPPSHLPRYLAGGAAVGFAVASAGFLASGLHQKARLEGTQQTLQLSGQQPVVTSTLTADQARSLRDVANRNLSLSLVSGVVAAGLAGLTAYLWSGQ